MFLHHALRFSLAFVLLAVLSEGGMFPQRCLGQDASDVLFSFERQAQPAAVAAPLPAQSPSVAPAFVPSGAAAQNVAPAEYWDTNVASRTSTRPRFSRMEPRFSRRAGCIYGARATKSHETGGAAFGSPFAGHSIEFGDIAGTIGSRHPSLHGASLGFARYCGRRFGLGGWTVPALRLAGQEK